MFAVLMIVRKLAPFILIAVVFGAIYAQGYIAGKKSGERIIEQLKTDSIEIINQAKYENQHAQQTLIESAKIIDTTNENHQKQINEISNRNNVALADRLQRESTYCRKSASNQNSTNSQISNDESNANGVFLERAGKRLVERHQLADEINESLRSCQDYLKNVQSTINQFN